MSVTTVSPEGAHRLGDENQFKTELAGGSLSITLGNRPSSVGQGGWSLTG